MKEGVDVEASSSVKRTIQSAETIEIDSKINRLIILSVQGSSLPLSTLVEHVASNLDEAVQRLENLDDNTLQSQGTFVHVFCIQIYVFVYMYLFVYIHV